MGILPRRCRVVGRQRDTVYSYLSCAASAAPFTQRQELRALWRSASQIARSAGAAPCSRTAEPVPSTGGTGFCLSAVRGERRVAVTVLDDMLTTSQAGRELGMSEQTVRRLLKLGRLAYTATPHGALIAREDCERLAAERQARQATSGSPAPERPA